MKTSELEKRVGITRANIRYYEKEGLLEPGRNKGNNYRDYSEEDAERLNRIKILRLLGISIPEIKALYAGDMELEAVMQKRLEEIREEERNLKEIRKVCECIIQRDLQISELDESLLERERHDWKKRMAEIWSEDTTKEVLNQKQMNRSIGAILIWGYILNAAVSFLTGDYFLNCFLNYDSLVLGLSTFFVVVFVPMAYAFCVYFTASVKKMCVIFHLTALTLTPFVLYLYILISGVVCDVRDIDNYDFLMIRHTDMAVFWLLIAVYTAGLFLLPEVWGKLFVKIRCKAEGIIISFGVIVCSTAMLTVFAGILSGRWVLPGVVFLVFTGYIGLHWMLFNMEYKEGSAYFTYAFAIRILNICASF